MKRTQFGRMLVVVGRMMTVLILMALPANGAKGQASPPSANVQTPTGWQSYTDPDFGWTIEYPGDWSAEIAFENPPAQAEGMIRRRLALYGPNRATIWVDSSDNRSRLTAESWFRQYKQPLLSSSPSEVIVQSATLNGQPAVLTVDDRDHTATSQVAVVAVRETLAVEITYLVLDGGTARQLFTDILRSFVWRPTKDSTQTENQTTTLPVITHLLPLRPAAATCCGISSPGNICVCCTRDSDGAEVGNCVWWACYKRRDVPCAGNANTWASCAQRAGKQVDTTPEAGALVTWNSSNHIAYVEQVSSDRKQVQVSEMNCYSTRACGGSTGYNGVAYRWVDVSGKQYIHSDQPQQCTDSNNPDGNYDQPGNNQQVSDSVHLKGWAKDDCGVDYVEFTATWPGQGWKVVKRVDNDCGRGDTCTYEYDWNLSGLPDGWITLGYDIYDQKGKKSLSPHGTRQIRKVGACAEPGLREPINGWRTKDHTLTFKWNDVGCSHTGYRLRVKTVSDMNSGGETLADVYVNGVEQALSFGSQWENRSLYWSVQADNAPGGARWAGAREFQIVNEPPSISFNTANGNGDSRIESRDRYWTFRGTANDPEGQLNRIEWRCDGDNCGNEVSRSGASDWTYVRDNLDGRNAIRFVAYDNQGNRSNESRTLDLNIDRAAPTTSLSLNNESNSANWPAWFTAPVTVRLSAVDSSTGQAQVGVAEARYRLDGGVWQAQAGAGATFDGGGDGVHTVEYYAVDKVGNTEGSRSVTFRIDKTPPNPPTGIVVTPTVSNDAWQMAQNTPTFGWAASSDATSGLWGYQLYFGTDPAGVGYQSFLAADPRTWTPQPGGVRTGTYYLRGRTRDVAGNWSAWTDLFTFRYDGTTPENPTGVTHAAGISNDTWQRITNLADFAWPVPHDEGAGIKDYAVYWGADPAGTSSSRIPNPQYQSPTPLCGANESCVGYLRLRSRDNVDNDAEDWTTAFVLRYDNAPPVADFTFREGMTTTQTLVNLRIAASDAGSGLREMRLSGDGQNWTSWEVYATERPWSIPGISRQSWPVYLQVRDGVGLASEVVSHTIYLDVNPQQPRSAGYRLFDYALSAGSGAYTSTTYSGRGTLGQVMDSPPISNTQYLLWSGYEAGSQAAPIIEPGHDEFTFINGVFASGTGGSALNSSAYRMLGTVGEVGLPNNETVLVSQGHRLQPGFLAAVLPVATPTPTPTPTPGPTPTPTPTPACEFPRVSINNAALFTNNPNVTLSLCAPWATEMLLSNDGGFGDAQWEPFAATRPWTITTYGQQVLPRFVYAAFREANGTIHATYFDDIIYDPNPPTGSIEVSEGGLVARNVLRGAYGVLRSPYGVRQDLLTPTEYALRTTQYELRNTQYVAPLALLAPQDDGSVDLYVNATDDISGLAEIQVSGDAAFTGAAWEPYTALKPWTPEGGDGIKTVYARFKDSAGNVSAATDAQFALDTMPPIGGVALGQRVVGPATVTTTVFFGAEDNLSGVEGMRVSEDPDLTDDVWLPYTVTLVWPLPALTGGTEGGGALYVQYRDWAGNTSEVYSDTYQVDLTPPQVYVEVAPGETFTRTVNIYAYDELADLGMMRLSNDPLLFEGLVTMPYSETVTWAFDDRRVVWVQLSDSVGNWTEPYPAYAAPVLAPQAPAAAIGLDAGGMTLTWTHLDANARYEVWRDTRPYFDPTAPTTDTVKLDDVYPPVGGGEMIYTDATGDPNVTYYYAVVGVNALGQVSAVEKYEGVFRFGLTPGE